jgi:vacuolar-type H+-ATPase subunit D/Vma8
MVAFLGGLTLPLQIIDLKNDGQALLKNERSKMANEFRQLVQTLTAQANNVDQHLRNLINQYEQQPHQQANNEGNRHEQQPQQLPNHQDNRQTVSIFNPITVVFVPFFVIVISLITKKVFEVGFGVFSN